MAMEAESRKDYRPAWERFDAAAREIYDSVYDPLMERLGGERELSDQESQALLLAFQIELERRLTRRDPVAITYMDALVELHEGGDNLAARAEAAYGKSNRPLPPATFMEYLERRATPGVWDAMARRDRKL